VAASVNTHKPTVDEEPIATIFSGDPDFSFASVRGSRTPNEMFGFAARQVSAGDGFTCACAEAELGPDSGNTIAKTTIRVFCRTEVNAHSYRLERSFKAGWGMAFRPTQGEQLICRVPVLRRALAARDGLSHRFSWELI
jgi:hypothetical protein